jgi:hypothetical protein
MSDPVDFGSNCVHSSVPVSPVAFVTARLMVYLNCMMMYGLINFRFFKYTEAYINSTRQRLGHIFQAKYCIFNYM